MTANFTKGVLVDSSWHRLEELGVMSTAAEMIEHGERVQAWPIHVSTEALITATGLKCHKDAIVARYRGDHAECVGVVGNRYQPTTPAEWRTLVTAAVEAGAKPTGCFSLRDGRLVVATFEIGESNGIKTQFILVDSFDGSFQLTAGFTSIRVVCCNTLSAAMHTDGKAMARLRHTATLSEKIEALREIIPEAIKSGQKVKDLYHKAESLRISQADAEKVFDKLFPAAAPDATPNAKTRAENARAAGRIAAAMPVNYTGPTLATLWNAATYLVDRTESGDARKLRGGSRLDSMLLGNRGERVEEIMTIIEVMMADGTIQAVPAPEAIAMGCNPSTVGASVLADMLDALPN